MRTLALHKLHLKQMEVLEMIIKADQYIDNKATDLVRYENSKSWYIGIYSRQELIREAQKVITKYSGIKQRLLRYYVAINSRMAMLQIDVYKHLEGVPNETFELQTIY